MSKLLKTKTDVYLTVLFQCHLANGRIFFYLSSNALVFMICMYDRFSSWSLLILTSPDPNA